jgi:hypothetical protein
MRTAGANGTSPAADHDLIRTHYADFNARRVDDAARRFHPDATVEHVTGRVEQGPDGYRVFAEHWLAAFPDAALDVRRIQARAPGLYDVDLLATGTHTGTLVYGSRVFRPTNLEVRLPARELLQIEPPLFRFANLSFDLQDVARQLATVDTGKLLRHLARIQQIGDQLGAAPSDPCRRRELIDRLGRYLDEARHVVRPYFR